MSQKIQCALIGLGRIASTLENDTLREKPASHAGAVYACPDTEICGGFDISLEARTEFARQWNLDREKDLFSDAPSLLKEKKPDILHIATHEDSHLEYLALAVKAKVPVVILEKPVSDSLRRARKMENKLGLTRVVVNHERRYSADYLRVRKHIGNRTYGDLLSVSGRLYMGMKHPVKSILLHDGTHMLDIIPFLTGVPLTNLRVLKPSGAGHSLHAEAESGEVSVFCEFGNSRDHLVFELELSFTEGRIRIGNGIYEEWESRPSTFYENMRSLYPVPVDPIGKTAYFSGMLQDAVKLCRDPEASAVSSYKDGVKSLALIHQLRKECRK